MASLLAMLLALQESEDAEARRDGGPPVRPSDPAAAVDPSAIARLETMGAFLRAQGAMVVKTETTTDEVLQSGQKIQLHGRAELKIRRPDRLVANVVSDRKTRHFVYDGRSFTIYAPRAHYYATVPAPPTLRELAELAARRYDVELPLADLFYWGTPESGAAEILFAMNVGPSTVQGAPCDHYAFRQRDVDWQIWIQRGEEPLPRKLVITTTQEMAQPQHVVLLSWSLNPLLEDGLFVFEPPRDARAIELRMLNARAVPGQGLTRRDP